MEVQDACVESVADDAEEPGTNHHEAEGQAEDTAARPSTSASSHKPDSSAHHQLDEVVDADQGVSPSDIQHTDTSDGHDDPGGDAAMASTYSPAADADSDVLQLLSAQTSSIALSSRPLSAAHAGAHLRGSRPNSAAIAAQIEGFENDFLGVTDGNPILDDVPEGGLSTEEEEVTTEQLIAEKQQEYAALAETSDVLQQRTRQVLDLRNKGWPAVSGGLSQLEGADTRYRAALKAWCDLRKEREEVAAHYQTKVFDMKTALEGRIQRAEEIANTLKHFKREVALTAEHSKTGKAIPHKVLSDMEGKERALEEEVQRVRLKNIHLGNALKKLESTIRHKEQLAEGLHLIDFEQLKIENQSLNEKIEERNEELLKLRKKTTMTVQILTHMKAKLAFVETENEALQAQLKQLEATLAGKRDELASLKSTRDRLWQQQRQLKEGSVFVTNPMLVQDMQAQKEKRDDLMAEIEVLKQRYAGMVSSAGGSPSASGSRGGSPLQAAAAPAPAHLHSPLRHTSSKAPPVKLLVASTGR